MPGTLAIPSRSHWRIPKIPCGATAISSSLAVPRSWSLYTKSGNASWTTPFARNSGASGRTVSPCGSSTSATTAAVNAGAVTATNCGSSPTRGSCAGVRPASMTSPSPRATGGYTALGLPTRLDCYSRAGEPESRLRVQTTSQGTPSGQLDIAEDISMGEPSTFRTYQVTGQRQFELV